MVIGGFMGFIERPRRVVRPGQATAPARAAASGPATGGRPTQTRVGADRLRARPVSFLNAVRRLDAGLDPAACSELADWLKAQGHHAVASSLLHTSNVHSRLFREQTSMVYPSGLEHLGLYVALQAGGIRESWKLTERVLRPDLKGDPCNLSVELQLAAYRTLIDAVSFFSSMKAVRFAFVQDAAEWALGAESSWSCHCWNSVGTFPSRRPWQRSSD